MINSKVTVEDESRLESFSEEELADDELSGIYPAIYVAFS